MVVGGLGGVLGLCGKVGELSQQGGHGGETFKANRKDEISCYDRIRLGKLETAYIHDQGSAFSGLVLFQSRFLSSQMVHAKRTESVVNLCIKKLEALEQSQ